MSKLPKVTRMHLELDQPFHVRDEDIREHRILDFAVSGIFFLTPAERAGAQDFTCTTESPPSAHFTAVTQQGGVVVDTPDEFRGWGPDKTKPVDPLDVTFNDKSKRVSE